MAEEISRNQDFLRTTFGVRDSPFFRPPFGARDERTDRIAADLGHPTIAMWNGTLGRLPRARARPSCSPRADQWFAAQTIIVGHANHPTVTTVYGELLDLIAERELRTVTPRRRVGHPVATAPGRGGERPGGHGLGHAADLRPAPVFGQAGGQRPASPTIRLWHRRTA